MPTTIESLFTDGPVIRPGDDGYDDERAGYNLIVEHHPAVIVGATGLADVAAAVCYARDHGLAVAVQATGHGVSVAADGAVMINTRRMDGVHIDPVNRSARIEAGVRSRQLVHEAAVHGLAPLNGSAPDVGAVSYILGGGVGMLGRRYGYAADHVRSIDVVTADGALRTVSAHDGQDLFWALRGGKGNFGVVVAMEIDLFPVARIYGGGLWFDADNTPNALHAYADWVPQVPDEMGSSVLMIRLPDFPGIPGPIRGRFVTHIRIAYIGSEHDGQRWVQQLRDAAPTLLDTVDDMPYSDVGTIHDEPTTPVPFYANNTMLATIDHDAIETLLATAGPATDATYLVELRHLDGAFSKPPKIANAIGRRDARFILYTGSVAAPGQLDALRHTHRALHAAMKPWSTGGVCANFLSGPEITTDELRSGFRPADFTRLTELKHRYDPDNMFRINHNLPRTP